METVAAADDQVEAAVACLVDAFVDDPQMAFFFPVEPWQRFHLVQQFFTILMEARLALGMPVFLVRDDSKVLGAAMGYDTRRPDWLPQHKRRWSELEAQQDGLPGRFARADAVMDRFVPAAPHHYLGVLGVAGEAQGLGIGRTLVEAFVKRSHADAQSAGIFLETANRQNLGLYHHLGFELLGQGHLDETTSLFCLFRPRR